MMRNLFFKKMVFTAIAMCLTSVLAFAWEGHAPLQAFIDREKSEHSFTEVNNLWTKDNYLPKSMTAPYVKDATLLTIDFDQVGRFLTANNRCINLVLPNPQGGNYVIELAQYSPFSDFTVDTDNGAKQEKYNYTHGLHYRGVVKGMPGSIAAFSFFNNEVYGIFSIQGVGNISIVPNTMISKDAGIQNYILYNDADLLIAPEGPGCSTDQLPDLHSPMKDMAEDLGKNVFSTCKEVKIYLRADYATYLAKSSNTTIVANFCTAIFNVVSTIYRNEGIYVALHKLIVNTASDEYQSLSTNSSSNFLNKFGQVTQNAMQGGNLAMLYSTRGGGMGGVAWLDVLCDSYSPNGNQHAGPYAFMNINTSGPGNFPNYSWNTSATAHELGHNLGSPHTHACRWTTTGYTQNGQAIDGCYTQEGGPCNLLGPQYPANGTIMSYCHLVQGQGISMSLANGFGTAPGNRIRSRVNSNTCMITYKPNVPMTAIVSNANRECTDPDGITYYWNDGTNADTSGDRIILKIKKNGNVIGDLDQVGFTVKSGTLTGYGTGSGVDFTLPTGLSIPTDTNTAMRRFWSMTPITQPTSAVDVYVPFTTTDVSDINGSVPGTVTTTSLRFYNLTSGTADPSPAVFTGVTSTNINLYNNGTAASTTQWQLAPVGTTQYALFKTTKLYGGTGFVNYQGSLDLVNTKSGAKMMVYPNPFSDSWNIAVPQGEDMMLQVYGVDGKVIQMQPLNAGTVNTVNSKSLPTGMYFYRITGSAETFTGTIVKE